MKLGDLQETTTQFVKYERINKQLNKTHKSNLNMTLIDSN